MKIDILCFGMEAQMFIDILNPQLVVMTIGLMGLLYGDEVHMLAQIYLKKIFLFLLFLRINGYPELFNDLIFCQEQKLATAESMPLWGP